jgi:hypothetical protein
MRRLGQHHPWQLRMSSILSQQMTTPLPCSILHTGRVERRKSRAVQFPQRPCQCAAQVIFGIAVAPGKAWASFTEQNYDSRKRSTSSQQLFGDPFVGDTPVGVWESLQNVQPVQPAPIDLLGLYAMVRGVCWFHCSHSRRPFRQRQRSWRRGCLTRSGLDQRNSPSCPTKLCIHHAHPGRIAVALASAGLLIGEPGQPPQMYPVSAGQVAAVG